MRRGKYNAKKTVVDGVAFDSMKEAERYSELKLLLCRGDISGLRLQEPFVLADKRKGLREVKYIADFVYYDAAGSLVVEDVKGYKTDVYRLKKRWLLERYGINIREV